MPAYTVNTMLTKISLVGSLLSGGENDGVFGLSYRVHGTMSSPALTVNPLSAIAPGILRRMLGAIDGTTARGGAHEPAETGDTVTTRGRRIREGIWAQRKPSPLKPGERSTGRPEGRPSIDGYGPRLHRPKKHVLLAAERQLDDSAGFQVFTGDERLLVAKRARR